MKKNCENIFRIFFIFENKMIKSEMKLKCKNNNFGCFSKFYKGKIGKSRACNKFCGYDLEIWNKAVILQAEYKGTSLTIKSNLTTMAYVISDDCVACGTCIERGRTCYQI